MPSSQRCNSLAAVRLCVRGVTLLPVWRLRTLTSIGPSSAPVRASTAKTACSSRPPVPPPRPIGPNPRARASFPPNPARCCPGSPAHRAPKQACGWHHHRVRPSRRPSLPRYTESGRSCTGAPDCPGPSGVCTIPAAPAAPPAKRPPFSRRRSRNRPSPAISQTKVIEALVQIIQHHESALPIGAIEMCAHDSAKGREKEGRPPSPALFARGEGARREAVGG